MKAIVHTSMKLAGATVAAFVIALVVVLAATRVIGRSVTADRAADVLADAIPADALARCRAATAAPARIPSGARFAFYAADGAPLHADAPVLDRALLDRMTHEGRRSAGDFDRATQESRAVIRLAEAGPCVYAGARWQFDGKAVVPALAITVAGAALAAVLLAVFVGALVVRPLLARILRLRRAALSVGSAGFDAAPAYGDEAGEIAAALRTAHDRLVADAKLRAERSASLEWVLAEVGHDVRTPLSSLQLALDELAEQAPASALPGLRRALSDVVYVRSLTSNLLLASGLRGGTPPEPTAVDLGAIAQRAADRAAPFALRRGIDLALDIAPDLVARGDETSTEQALTNLLENSIGHCEPGTNVRLVAMRAGAVLRVTVEDDGLGVVPEDLPRLGDRTFRSDAARTRDGRGTGLGLAITRAVCERAGWTVHFEKVEPRGLRAVIEAPSGAHHHPAHVEAV